MQSTRPRLSHRQTPYMIGALVSKRSSREAYFKIAPHLVPLLEINE
jgi:hypothetical protein